jgi:Kef-type K+ transport system membrane component KefB
MIFSQVRSLGSETLHKVESIALGIFAPLFFAVAGLKVNILNLLTPQLLLLTLIVIAVAVAAKALGVYLGARFIGKADHWTAVFYGSGLNARGSMGIIAATIGLSLGILTQDMFSIIVTLALVTSLVAPVPQRWALQHI